MRLQSRRPSSGPAGDATDSGTSAIRPVSELRPVFDGSRHATVGSRWVHQFAAATTHSAATVAFVVALVAWVAIGIATSFPAWWATVLYSTSAAVTMVMVFTIQHTQARAEIATQRKLDELLRAIPSADNRLIAAEVSSDDELAEITRQQLEQRDGGTSSDRAESE